MQLPKISLIALTVMMAFASVAEAQQRRKSPSQGKNPSRSRGREDRRTDQPRRPYESKRPSRGDTGRAGGNRQNPFGQGTRPRYESGRGQNPFPSNSQRRPSPFDRRGSATPQRFGRPLFHDNLRQRIAGGRGFGSGSSLSLQFGGLRVGYVSYSDTISRYRSARRSFSYPFYCYDPYAPQTIVVASPWYGYSFLPPYLDGSRVTYADDRPAWGWDQWDRYDLQGDRDREDSAVRDALDDLRDAFETSSGRIADRLVPERGDVAIFNEGRYDYSLNPDDFQQMFSDGVEDAETIDYRILEVRRRGDEVRIRAQHTFTDSWGKEDSAIHLITLRRDDGGDYVIREFGTE
ncbi:hypothetical protein EON81_05490 [bacterium]|nr:MAG: hypothetical protein EON81_05490 [bacterium]